MKTNAQATAHVFIRGHVQGVSFRANLWREAKKHMLLGWVKNLKDGTVEAILQGEPEKVNEVIKWCHIGPAAAKVEKVDVAYESSQERFTHFFIK